MAKLFGVGIDLQKSELLQARVQNLATAPVSPVAGQIYFDTVLGFFRVYDGASWISMLDTERLQDIVGNMVTGNTETGIAVTYDDSSGVLNFVVGAINTLPEATGDISANSHKITNLSDGTAAGDAVNKGQLDAVANGLDWKQSVRVATAAAGTLASSFENGDTVDGVVLVTGDRILIKDQVTGSQNGIYTVNASGAPTRATDADADAEVTAGMTVFVSEGTTNGNTSWTLTTDDTIVVGTTALVFTQTSAPGSYVGGDGLTLTGLTFSVNVDGSTIQITGDTLSVVSGVFTKKYTTTIGDNASTSFNVDHNLNTRAVNVSVYDSSTYAEIITSVSHSTVNRVVVDFDVAPTTNQYTVVVVG